MAVVLLAASANSGAGQAVDIDGPLAVEARAGWRTSELVWTIGTRDAVGSEVSYQGLRAPEVAVAARCHFGLGPPWRVSLAFHGRAGTTVGGDARDSDYDGRGNEYSRSVSEITGEGTSRVAAAIGLQRTISALSWLEDIAFRMGYERNRRTLRMQNGTQVIPDNLRDDFLDGLDSRYHARWTGPWVAAEVGVSAGPGRLSLSAARHFSTSYYGEGEWNLQEDLMQPRSFTHEGPGSGFDIGSRYALPLGRGIVLAAEIAYVRRTLTYGVDVGYLKTGDTFVLNLRDVVWSSRALNVGLSKSF